MKHKFEILCPSRKCSKCKKIIQRVEKIISQLEIDAEIEIITQLQEMLDFETWIIPSLFLDGKILTRGYMPTQEDILKILNQ